VQSSAVAQGPGSYALARGSLALGDFEGAWNLLEDTRRAGYETPDVHYARGQVLGHFYDEALMRAASINEPEIRKFRDIPVDSARSAARDLFSQASRPPRSSQGEQDLSGRSSPEKAQDLGYGKRLEFPLPPACRA